MLYPYLPCVHGVVVVAISLCSHSHTHKIAAEHVMYKNTAKKCVQQSMQLVNTMMA